MHIFIFKLYKYLIPLGDDIRKTHGQIPNETFHILFISLLQTPEWKLLFSSIAFDYIIGKKTMNYLVTIEKKQ